VNGGKPLPYAITFDDALKEAATTPPEERQATMAALMKRSDARQAHPTFEHLLPIYVGAGAAGEDRGVQLWTMPEASLSWAQYRFGDVPSVAG
jgi:aromatic ring-opening dioxygenase catalytic subunit (LigB family)